MLESASPTTGHTTALRGPCLTFVDNPFVVGDSLALHHEPDGLVIMKDGIIQAFGSYADIKQLLNDTPVHRFPDHCLIMPGFVDTHVHYPQLQVMGSYGKRLIDWLTDYTFKTEQAFSDSAYALQVAELFLQESLRAGTTTAAVYCTVHPQSADVFFQAAARTNRRMIAGKVLMDRNAPSALTDSAQTAYDQSKQLINQWHGKGRLSYAITPRFAPTSSVEQLDAAASLWKEYPDAYMQTHLSENTEEIEWVKQLFPDYKHYLDVYAHAGLVGPKALFGHAIHLSEVEWQLLADSGSSVVHCPTSNSFLGSGLFNFRRALEHHRPVRTGLATDVGGGTSLSMLQTMGSAYSIGQFGKYSLSAPKAFYMATLGGARALYLEDRIGCLQAGFEADILVLDMQSTPIIKQRMQHCTSLEEAMFVQMIMADDRATHCVYVGGALAYERAVGNSE